MQKLRLEMFLRFTSKQTYRFFLFLYILLCHTPQFKMLVFAFQSEIWIAENFNFSVFKVFCLSLSWKYRFSQNVHHAKVQSKTNKHCKFHVDLTRKGLSKSRFKKLGMVPKKLYRNTLKLLCSFGLFLSLSLKSPSRGVVIFISFKRG